MSKLYLPVSGATINGPGRLVMENTGLMVLMSLRDITSGQQMPSAEGRAAIHLVTKDLLVDRLQVTSNRLSFSAKVQVGEARSRSR